MKNLVTILGWTFGILLIVFAFILYFQKEQNQHHERVMNAHFANADLKAAQTIQVEEVKSLREKCWDGIKGFCAFCLSVFTKAQ